jgi:hypothetical protein
MVVLLSNGEQQVLYPNNLKKLKIMNE